MSAETATSLEIVTTSREETEELGGRIARAARADDVIALWGELGVGKTVLVRGLAKGLGVPQREVTSPTFVIVHEHDSGRLPLFHIDLYRLAPADVASTGWDESLAAGGIVAIEWPDRLGLDLPADRLDIRLEHAGPNDRRIRVAATGPRSRRLLEGSRP